MVDISVLPSWFFGYDVALELLFAIVALIVSVLAFKVYYLSGQNKAKLFGVAFSFISLAYLLQSATNFLIISKLNEPVCRMLRINDVVMLNNMGMYAYIFFFITGLLVLAHISLDVKNETLYSLLFGVIALSLVFSSNKLYLFYILSSFVLVFIITNYVNNFLLKRDIKTLLVLVAFILLLLGRIHFLIAINHSMFYMAGHFMELIAYVLILANLILVTRK